MVIIDASIINKLFLPNEEGYDKALEIVEKHLQKSEEIFIPDLLFYEVANTLVTKTAIPENKIQKSLAQLGNFNLLVIHPSVEEIMRIAKFAKNYGISVYDASYAVLASGKGCNLFTADFKFVKKVNLPFVKHLSEYSSDVN